MVYIVYSLPVGIATSATHDDLLITYENNTKTFHRDCIFDKFTTRIKHNIIIILHILHSISHAYNIIYVLPQSLYITVVVIKGDVKIMRRTNFNLK